MMVKPDQMADAYWNSPITRSEAQNIFDEFAKVLVGVQERLIKQEFMLSFMMEELEIEPGEIQAFIQKKMEEFNAQQAKAKAEAESK